jgi:negative regulator of sigma E activity
MNTSSHIIDDQLQELFDALPQPTASLSFEQETMRRVNLSAQKKQLIEERKRMLTSMLVAAVVAACATAAIVSGLTRLSGQQQAIIQFLREVDVVQALKLFAKEYVWMLAAGAFIWLLSVQPPIFHSYRRAA